MIHSIEESPLYRIANPRSIAFFGASNRFSSMGTLLLKSMQGAGYRGAIYPIHKSDAAVLSCRAYQSIADLPEVPDLAVIVLPTEIVCPVMQECGEKGIRHAIIVSGGFREVGGNGIEMEKQLAEISLKYGIKLLGPNCLGIANPYLGLNTTPLPIEGKPGFIGLASQSGSIVAQMYDYLNRLGMGFSTAISVGNQLNTDLVDCMEYLVTCPNTKVITLYIESINRGSRFLEVARTISKIKPIVALYTGGSEAGRKAALSHTGSMSGPDYLYDGVFRQSGIVRAQNISELFDFAWALGSLPKPGGNRLAILTDSGGPGAVAADIAGRMGLKLPGFSNSTQKKLAPYIPGTGNANNPIDLTFMKDPDDLLLNIPRVILEDPNIDMLMIYFLIPVSIMRMRMSGMGMSDEEISRHLERTARNNAKMAVKLRQTFEKPVVGFTFRSLKDYMIRSIIENGLPVFPNPERAARSLVALVEYHHMQDKTE